ncbi:HAD-IA family hydrolase [Kineococcus sp. SYSU DK018]|uniref:HAD-IA family hydrolase n=1 Tax=Kineococcus sp. SYSU DK018 TaxID=3383139 RepID=UPI003D7E4A3E
MITRGSRDDREVSTGAAEVGYPAGQDDDMVTPTATRAVLFDADGVLVDSHAGYRNVWQRWSQLHQLDPVVVLAATHARRPVDTVAEVAPHLDAVAEYARLVDYVNELPGAFPVFPDAGDLLALLAPERWAVVTSGDADRVRERLRAGALPVPRIVVDGQAVRRGKPDPEGHLQAAEQLQMRPGDCLVVEDAPAGGGGGSSCGDDGAGVDHVASGQRTAAGRRGRGLPATGPADARGVDGGRCPAAGEAERGERHRWVANLTTAV